MHSQPSIFCLNYLYRNVFTDAESLDMSAFSWCNILQWLGKRKEQIEMITAPVLILCVLTCGHHGWCGWGTESEQLNL